VRTKGVGWTIDEITRDEDAGYVSNALRHGLFGFVAPEAFPAGRLLDFGSGSGASTVVLARLLPQTEIVGVELEPRLIEIARARAAHYALPKLAFAASPDPESLPADLGQFDFINLGAVYEHLLPDERQRLLPRLWAHLAVGGVFFVSQLPHRFYPLEYHTTGLPLVNYLPDRLACAAAQRFAGSLPDDVTWPELLRMGIRGGTARSVGRDLVRGGGEAALLRPIQPGIRDHADLWYAARSEVSRHPARRVMRLVFRGIGRLSGQPFVPSLSLAYRKLA
jgi:SAM-dependent methyltransferase